jgi:predicted nucleic acid-binding protein
MKTYLLDTSFLSAFLNNKDSNYFAANEIATEFGSAIITVPTVVFAELTSFSRNKEFRDFSVKTSLKMADETPSLNESNLKRYIEFTKNLSHSFTAIDSVILFLAKENKSELVTFDKKLQKLYQSV